MISFHLKELKFRFLSLLLSYCLLFYFLYNNKELLLYKYTALSELPQFIYTDITEAFFTYLRFINFICLLFITPLFLYHLWLFLIPGLYKREKSSILKGIIIMSSLIYISISYLIPNIYKFFMTYSNELLNLEPKFNEYMNLTINLMMQIAIISSISIILYLIKIKTNYLIKNRKIMIIISLIISSIITPPEIINQIIMSIPIIISYELKIYNQLKNELLET